MQVFEKNLGLKVAALNIRSNGDSFVPFDTYFETDIRKNVPFWWTTYNKLKHDFSKNLESANLQAALCSLGALFILNCKIPYHYEHLILNEIVTSPNFLHIGDFLSYMAQSKKNKVYNVLAQTRLFTIWLSYNAETIGLSVTGSMQVGPF